MRRNLHGYNETLLLERNVRRSGNNVVNNWACETGHEEENLVKQFIPCPYPVIYNFESILKTSGINKANLLFAPTEYI